MISLKFILTVLIFNADQLRATENLSLVIDNGAEVNMENLLIEFMTDLKKFGFETLQYYQLVVLGKNGNILQATKVVLENSMPYFISTKAEAMAAYSAADNVVLIFIDGFSEFEMNSAFAKLPSNFKCRTLIISMKKDTTDESVATTILSAVKMKLRNVMFARFDGQVIKIYGKVQNVNCEQEITLLNKWIPKKGFRKNTNIIGHGLILNERGCPMNVSTFQISPTMMLQKAENKSLHISGGVEGHLVKAISEYLNMVPVVKVPLVKESFWISPNLTNSGIIGDVAREVASFGIGQIRLSLQRAALIDFTKSYQHECLVWTVPLRTKYKYSPVISEFSPITWIMVIFSVLLFCGLAVAISKLKRDHRASLKVFDVIAMTLNYSIPHLPSSMICKLLFLLYLNCSRVISSAYSTSLSSILTTTRPEPVILDEDGILAARLRPTGSWVGRGILAEFIDPNSTRVALINRYEVITSLEAALARIVDHQDIAYLRAHSTIDYVTKKLLMAGKPVQFSYLPSCILSYDSVVVTPKGSRLTDKFNNIISRLIAAGLHKHWSSLDQVTRARIEPLTYNSLTLSQLESIFVLYLCCLIPAVLVFAAELIAFKLKLNWFSR